ncbi:ribonuclease Y [Paludisphaera mucosa]|uniref:Ribonuclease Y n=1 Tax=Paludisphaera mucosa TaxID=3030827 RepID=A0ABT6F5J0_9BACT|nr:ribonuclease Y [Paludisphaera mucosa]
MYGELIAGLIGLILGVFGAWGTFHIAARSRATSARGLVEQLLSNAHRESETILRQAELTSREESLRLRHELEAELEGPRKEIREQERRLEKRGDLLDQRIDMINKKERDLDEVHRLQVEKEAGIAAGRREVERLEARRLEELQRVGGLSAEEARRLLLARIEEELKAEAGDRILRYEAHVRETSRERAREILAVAIQRYAASHTAEVTVSTVDIPNDEMKGRIIGREGRNIRAFEKATGVDVIVDDTPGVVIVTGFDSIRREVAKLALERLIQDGRIHPSRIEEIVKDTHDEMDQHILKVGREAAREADVIGLHEKVLDYLGRLKFRTSYSQNVLRHSIEVAFLAGMMAEEIGLDGALGRRCGLLHDLGKAADHEMEGGHPAVGAELLRRYGEGKEVTHAALGHHDDLRVDAPYTVLVAAADAISASRPGARRETLEKYVRRLEELESLALGFPGVEQAYAIQAGREVRVMVDSRQLDDASAASLCRDVAKAIEAQLTYPGEVKVTVLRESRSVEYAR